MPMAASVGVLLSGSSHGHLLNMIT